MRTITIKVREVDEYNAIEAKLEFDQKDGATELEAFTGNVLVNVLNHVMNSGKYIPPPMAVAMGPNCEKETEIQMDILRAGRKP